MKFSYAYTEKDGINYTLTISPEAFTQDSFRIIKKKRSEARCLVMYNEDGTDRMVGKGRPCPKKIPDFDLDSLDWKEDEVD